MRVEFQQIETLVLYGGYDLRSNAQGFNERVYHARIDLAWQGKRRLLLATDSREQHCEIALEYLTPLAEQLASALGVSLRYDEPVERRQRFLRAITRAPVWMHGLFLLLGLLSTGWLAWRAMPGLARLQAEYRFEEMVAQSGGHEFERTAWKIAADDYGPVKGYSFEDQPITDRELVGLRDGLLAAGRFALNLSGTGITDSGLEVVAGNENLVLLNLYGTGVTDQGVEVIGGCKGLIELNLNRTVVGDGAVALCSQLPNLKCLRLWGTRVTDDGTELLAEMKGLRELYLNDTLISDQAVAKLRTELPETQIYR